MTYAPMVYTCNRFSRVQACEKEYERKVASGTADDDAKFKYAWHLVKCGYKSDIRKGISMMAGERFPR